MARLALPVGDVLAHQVFAGDAEIDAALRRVSPGDLGRRQEGDLDVVAALDAGAVAAVVAGQLTASPALASTSSAWSLQPALGGNGEGDGHADAPPVSASMRSSQTEKPTPGIGVLRAEQRQQPVVAAAAGERARGVADRDLEDEPGVVVERAAEGGVVADGGGRQAFGLRPPSTRARKTGERGAERQAGGLREILKRRRRPVERHVDGEELFERRERLGRQPDAAQFGLFDQPPRDLLRRAAG